MFSDDIDLEEPTVWGKHEFCAFKCGDDCDQVMELHPLVTVICEDGRIIENVQAHWDDGVRSVGIQGGYYIDDRYEPEDAGDDWYIIWPMWAADDYNLPESLKEKVKQFREEKVANGLYV